MVFFTLITYAFILSWILYFSPGVCSLGGRIASARPSSIMTFFRSNLLTTPDIMSSSLLEYSSKIIPRSASLIRCMTTCFAVCAAILPNLRGVTSTSTTSPTSKSGLNLLACSKDSSVEGSVTVSTMFFNAKTRTSPVKRSIYTSTFCAEP